MSPSFRHSFRGDALAVLFSAGLLLVFPGPLPAQFTDSYAAIKAQDYVEQAKSGTPEGQWDDTLERELYYLAQTLSQTDRANIPVATLLEHIRLSRDVRQKFYPYIPQKAYQDYVLALRIRYERSAHPYWRRELSAILKPVVGDTADVDQAAALVLGWLNKEVQLEDEGKTYPIGLKGDLDPLTTLKGGAGTEMDLSILGVAALRSVGIASRLVYAPTLAGEDGGKMWLEYHSQDSWIPWCPGGPKDQTNHKAWLQKEWGAKLAVVVTDPAKPTNITQAYCSTSPIWACPDPLTVDFDVNYAVLGKTGLTPIMGRDLFNNLPKDMDYGFGIQSYLITAGQRDSRFGQLLVQTQPKMDAWYSFKADKEEQLYSSAEKRPGYFLWTETYSRIYQASWQ